MSLSLYSGFFLIPDAPNLIDRIHDFNAIAFPWSASSWFLCLLPPFCCQGNVLQLKTLFIYLHYDDRWRFLHKVGDEKCVGKVWKELQ